MSETTMRTARIRRELGSRGPWRVAAAALLPLGVLGLLLAALWNPMDRLGTVEAAIVNLDEPVEVDGQMVPLGRQLASGLVSGGDSADPDASEAAAAPPSDKSYAWEITDADSAAAGLKDGTYAAVVTIPEDFSAAATSFGGDDPAQARQATIDVETPPGGRVVDDALARIVATTATSILGSSLTETYVDNVAIGFNSLADGLGEASDGASKLADGAGDAGAGASQLADGAGQLADGAQQASSGADDLSDGAGQLASGAGAAAGGADQLAGGASQLAGGARDAAGGADDLADGASQLETGARGITKGISESAAGADDLAAGGRELADGAQQVADGLAPLAQGADRLDDVVSGLDADELQEGLDQASAAAEATLAQLSADLGCTGANPPPSCARLADLAAAMQGATGPISEAAGQLGQLQDGVHQLADGLGQLQEGAQGVARGVTGIADGNAELADGLYTLADASGQVAGGAGQLSDGATALSNGVGQLADGAGGIASGASGLADGVDQLAVGAGGIASGASGLADGVGQLGSGAGNLADGAGELSTGIGQLADGAGGLADGIDEAVGQIPTYTEDERKNLASVVADPVTAPSVDDLSTGGTGPLFAVVALWLGALALLTVLPPVATRALGSTRGSVPLALAAFRLPALVGLLTGAAVGAILAAVEGLAVGGWLAATGVGALVSVCFVALHQGFLGLLGDLGRGISLLFAVLLIGTGVVATVPAPLLGLAELLPTGAARDALAAAVVPGVDGVGGALAALVVWALAGLALAVGVTARRRVVRVGRLLRA